MRRLVILLALLVTACGGGRSTPEETFESLRAAFAAQDGERVHALHDRDFQEWLVRRVRDIRGRLDEGQPSEQLLGAGETAATYLDGDVVEAVARVALRHSVIGRERNWFDAATVLEVASEGEQQAALRLRGVDGRERVLYFVREPEGWAYDQYRHHQERLGAR